LAVHFLLTITVDRTRLNNPPLPLAGLQAQDAQVRRAPHGAAASGGRGDLHIPPDKPKSGCNDKGVGKGLVKFSSIGDFRLLHAHPCPSRKRYRIHTSSVGPPRIGKLPLVGLLQKLTVRPELVEGLFFSSYLAKN
jgi:hypothetical protein